MSRKLTKLVAEIKQCRLCADNPMGLPLPHEPRPVLIVESAARLCICGQAPGTRVHASGLPFTDPSGDRLRDWMGVTPEEFYDSTKVAIIPMGFCFPGLDAKGGDLPPRRECADRWRSELFGHLGSVELILLAGQYAQKWHLGKCCKASLTETVRNWRQYTKEKHGPAFLPLPHPSWRNNAWLKKNPWFETEVLPYLRIQVRHLIDSSE